MRLMKTAAALLCAAGLTAFASTSAPTATLTDPDGQTWNNCTWSAALVSPKGNPTISGSPISSSLLSVSGNCNASGVLTGTFVDTSSLDQTGGTYTFTIWPNASVSGPTVIPAIAVVGATPSLSTALSTPLKAVRFAAGITAFGYADGEISPSNPPAGSTYYNVVTGVRLFNGAGWSAGSVSMAHFYVASTFTGIGPTAFVPTHTLDVQDTTATTGSTSVVFTDGAGQTTSGANVFTVRSNAYSLNPITVSAYGGLLIQARYWLVDTFKSALSSGVNNATTTITPTTPVWVMTGTATTTLATMTPPANCTPGSYACEISLVLKTAVTTVTSDNIAAVYTWAANRRVDCTYDLTASKWYCTP